MSNLFKKNELSIAVSTALTVGVLYSSTGFIPAQAGIVTMCIKDANGNGCVLNNGDALKEQRLGYFNGNAQGGIFIDESKTTTMKNAAAKINKISGNGIVNTNNGEPIVLNNLGFISANASLSGGRAITRVPAPAPAPYALAAAYAETHASTANGINSSLMGDNDGVILSNANLLGGNATVTIAAAYADSTADTLSATANGINGYLSGDNNGYILANAIIKGGKSNAFDLAISNSSANTHAVTANGINGNLAGHNTGLIQSNATLISGNASTTTTTTDILTITPANATATATAIVATANGINGRLVKDNTGLIQSNATLISGSAKSTAVALAIASANNTGNGIHGNLMGSNYGVISGHIDLRSGLTNGYLANQKSRFSGSGLANTSTIDVITNSGLIKGSSSALSGKSIGAVSNYGILAGRRIFSNGEELYSNQSTSNGKGNESLNSIRPTTENNLGVYVKLKQDPKLGKYTAADYNDQGSQFGEFVQLDKDGRPVIDTITIGQGGTQELDLGLGSGKQSYTVLNGDVDGDIVNNQKLIKNTNPDSNNNFDTFITANSLKSKTKNDHLIINASGIEYGHAGLVVDKDIDLNDSIINGYQTALYIGDRTRFTGSNVILNGGGLQNESPVIIGSSGDNTIIINGKSVINGAIRLGGGDGNDTLNIGQNVYINGNIDGQADGHNKTVLNIGEADYSQKGAHSSPAIPVNALNVFSEISGFTTINVLGNVKLFETAKVDDNKYNYKSNGQRAKTPEGKYTAMDIYDVNINLKQGGNLLVRINPAKKAGENYVGHALYDGNTVPLGREGHITLHSDGGDLMFVLNGIGNGENLSMGATRFDNTFGFMDKTKHITTDSSVIFAHNQGCGLINFNVSKNLPDQTPGTGGQATGSQGTGGQGTGGQGTGGQGTGGQGTGSQATGGQGTGGQGSGRHDGQHAISDGLYHSLNDIYHSIVDSGKLGTLAKTTLVDGANNNEKLKSLYSLLDQIYYNTPYTYTLKSSRDGLKLFESHLDDFNLEPNKGQIIFQGKAIYSDVINDTQSSFATDGSSWFNNEHRNYKTTTSTAGGLGAFEYGIQDNASIGVAFGENRQHVNFRGSNKVRGNSAYVGVFGKSKINHVKLSMGVGYQHASNNISRVISNGYDTFKSHSEASVNGMNAFAEARYGIDMKYNWQVEPKAKISYYYLHQGAVSEHADINGLPIWVGSQNNSTMDVALGIDAAKIYDFDWAKMKNTFSVEMVNTVGNKDKQLSAGFIGNHGEMGSAFKVAGAKLPQHTGKVGYSIEMDTKNNIMYYAGLSFDFAKNYNSNINASVGVGYKF